LAFFIAGDGYRGNLAAAQGNALAGIRIADRMPQPTVYTGGIVHKREGSDARGGVPHPHACPPGTTLLIPHRFQNSRILLTPTLVDYLHRTACGLLQSIG